jgi:hypothetical protein
MASARPVVSTHLAGIPELVVDGETGMLVSPGDITALTEALQHLLCDRELRLRYGRAGRARVEEHFRIEHTVEPLLKLFEGASGTAVKSHEGQASRVEAAAAAHQIAYLIDRWPDNDLPLVERELEEMKRRDLPIVPFVCELNGAARFTCKMEQIAPSLEFLPDAMVIEGEWRANPALAQRLEEERARYSTRATSAVFLRQGRFALVFHRLLREKKVSHVHATSSRALVCALMLKKLVGVTVSAAIEPQPELARNWIEDALSQCIGGRLSDPKLLKQPTSLFLIDKTTFRSAPRKVLGLVGINLAPGARFWQEWSELLLRWSCSVRKSKIENRK